MFANQGLTITTGGTVTNQGSITALEGITMSGNQINNTTGAAIKTGDNLQVTANQIMNQGTVYAKENATLHTTGLLTSSGTVAARRNLSIEADKIDSSGSLIAGLQADGTIGSDGELTLSATQDLIARGQNLAGAKVAMTGTTVDLTNATTYAGDSAHITATAGNVNNSGGTLEAKHVIDISAQGALINDKTNEKSSLIKADQLVLNSSNISNRGGTIAQAGQTALTLTADTVDNTAGQIATNSTQLTIHANTLTNAQGKIQHAGDNGLVIETINDLDNAGGSIASNGTVNLKTQQIENTQGTITAKKELTITTDDLTNQAGLVVGDEQVHVSVANAIKNQAGIIESGKGLDVHSQTLNNDNGKITSLDQSGLIVNVNKGFSNKGGLLGTNGNLSLNAESLDNTEGQAIAAGNLALEITHGIDNTKGQLTAGDNLTLNQTDAGLDNQQGKIEAGENLSVKTAALNNAQGSLAANQNVDLKMASYTGAGAVTGNDITAAVNGDFTSGTGGSWKANHDLSLSAGGKVSNQGSIEAGRDLNVSSNTIANSAGAVLAANKKATVNAEDVTNSGSIFGNDITVKANKIANTNATAAIAATNTVNLYAKESLENKDDATIYSMGTLNIAGDSTPDANGQTVRTGKVLNQSATIEADGDIAIHADELTNKMASYTYEDVKVSETRYDQRGVRVSNINPNLYWICVDARVDDSTSAIRLTPGSRYQIPNIWMISESTWERKMIPASSRALIISRNNMQLNVRIVNNELSSILSGGQLNTASGSSINNISYSNERVKNRELVLADKIFMVTAEHRYYEYLEQFGISGIFFLVGTVGSSYTDSVVEQLPSDSSSIFGGGQSVIIQGKSINNVTLTPGSIGNSTNLNGIEHDRNVMNATGSDSTISTGIHTDMAVSNKPAGEVNQIAGSNPSAEPQVNPGHSTGIPAPGSDLALPGIGSGNIQTLLPSANTGTVTKPQTNNGGNITLPQNGMYSLHPEPTSKYLVETNPRFASFKNFISSDYMLDMLNYNPDSTVKRLGDGFYEQKLVREQITDLTGRVYLSGYDSAESQYQALLDNGAATAQSLNLQVGIALTAEQQALLTKDMVWMVEQVIDGNKLLVPVVYLSTLHEGDLKANGAVIAADNVTISVDGKITNAGVIKGTEKVKVEAVDINNLGGTINGGHTTDLVATNNITNISGTIAGDNVSLIAGNDFKSETFTSTTTELPFLSRTASGNVATINAGEALTIGAVHDVTLNGTDIQVGKDLNLAAGNDLSIGSVATHEKTTTGSKYLKENVTNIVSNLDVGGNLTATSGAAMTFQGTQVDVGESLNLSAGSDIKIDAVKDSSVSDVTIGNSRNYKRVMNNDETVIGTSLNANGNINIQTPGSLTISGSDIVSDTGKIDLAANDGIQIQNVTEKHESLVESKKTKSGFMSKKTTVKRDYSLVNEVVGSTISGDEVNISSGADITVKGSNVVANNDLTLSANKDINIISADETGAKEHYSYTKTSGLFGGGGLGFTIGSKSEKLTVTEKSLGEVGSVIGSIKGDVNVHAGDKVNSIGTAFEAGQDINIIGKTVNIENSIDTVDQNTKYEFKQTGISVSLGGKILNSAMGVVNDVERSGQVADERLQALYVYKASEDLKKLKGVDSFDDVKKDTKVSISIGSSQTTSEQNVHTETVNESNIKAGNAVNIVATGDDVNITGTKITAPDINIGAVRDINLDAAQNKQQTDSKTSSSSWAVGVELGGSVFANANTGKGKENGTVVTNSETVIKAIDTVNLVSGNDTNINGSTVEGGKVIANIGGDLNIASLQDIDNYTSKNSSSGIGLSSDGVTGSFNQGKMDSTYESVVDQAGIYAGKDGFDINVGGNTDLKGAVIASEATPDKNKLSTDTLTYSDIQNKAEYEASSSGVSYSSKADEENNIVKGLSPNIGVSVNGEADSTTKSAVSPGEIRVNGVVVNPDGLSRDTEGSTQALAKIFDKKTVAERQELAQVFGEEAYKLVGAITRDHLDKAKKEAQAAQENYAKAEEALSRGDLKGYEDYSNKAKEQISNFEKLNSEWGSGGSARTALHGMVGGIMGDLSGGSFVTGAAGAGINQIVRKELKKLDNNALEEWGSAIVGAAASTIIGGSNSDSLTGAAIALSGTRNNCFLSEEDEQAAEEQADIVKGFKKLIDFADKKRDEMKLASIKSFFELQGFNSSHPDYDYVVAQTMAQETIVLDAGTFNVTLKLAASSRRLAEKLIEAGVERPDYSNAAHHIVAGNSPKAQEAREILEKFGIGIDEAANGVFLPTDRGVSTSAFHPSLHTNAYYEKVNDLLRLASNKSEALDILKSITNKLKDGTFMD